MSMQPPTRSSKPPLGGISGDWRRRLLRVHLPIALASALLLVLFLTLPSFDTDAYTPGDLFSGTFPQDVGDGAMDHEGNQGGGMDHQGGDS